MPTETENSNELISLAPATGEILWRGEPGDPALAIAAARKAWPHWASQPLTNRIEATRSAVALLRREAESIVDLCSRETGRPAWDCRSEMDAALTMADLSVSALADRAPLRRLEQGSSLRGALRHKPLGVVAILAPFSQPMSTFLEHCVSALLTGNAVIYKPSEKTPATGEQLVEKMLRSGLPEGLVNLIQGGPATGKKLVAHPGVNGVMFTGSSHNGIGINRQLAPRPDVLLSLEMSGNNPIIAWDCGDIHSAVSLIAKSAFLSSGQRCTSARRLIVSDRMYGVIVPELKRMASRLIVDAPDADMTPFMGPLIDNELADGLTESFVALMSHGGKPITHMRRPKPNLPFVTPGIIDVTDMAERPDIELFGPLLQVVRVADFDKAIAEANRTRFGLCAALIGGTAEQYNKFWANCSAGRVNWNASTHEISLQAPTGSAGLSGNHRPGRYYAADRLSVPVASAEADEPKAMLNIGLKNDDLNAEAA